MHFIMRERQKSAKEKNRVEKENKESWDVILCGTIREELADKVTLDRD